MSDKALFVMDIPENGCMDCAVCKESFFKTICGITGNGVSGNRERGGFPEECPLKRLPERRKGTDYLDSIFQHPAFDYGWNACIDAITGGIEIDKLYAEKCRELAEERKKHEWIPCSERLPEMHREDMEAEGEYYMISNPVITTDGQQIYISPNMKRI